MKRSLPIFALVFAIASLPFLAHAATMSLAPSAASVSAGDIVTVRVIINPAGTAVNNAEGVLHFPSDVVKVLSVSKAGSLFPLWVEDPTFSNAAGTVSFNGGIPNPGATAAGTALSISFHAVRAGSASLSLSDAAVRANDGMGTDVLTSVSGTQITVASVAAPAAPAPMPATPAASAGTPVTTAASTAIAITSTSHPDQDAWYQDNHPSFVWKLPANATSVQLGIDTSLSVEPSVTYAKPIEEKVIDALEDGIWHFTMRYRTGSVWSKTSTYAVHIDTTAPTITSHDFLYDQTQDSVLVSVAGSDESSGIASYEISIDGAASTTIPASRFLSGAQPFKIRVPGIHRITLAAIDGAGNRVSIEGSFSVPPSLSTQILFHIGPFGVSLLVTLIGMALFSLLALAAALLEWGALMGYRRRRSPAMPAIRKDLHSGFLKMKENMDKDIRALDRARTKRELSREELALYRRQVENMTALERHLDKMLKEAE